MTAISPRAVSASAIQQLISNGHPPALAKILAARGITDGSQMDTTFAALLPFDRMKGIREMARLLADAIAAQQRLLVIADYDADGATACTVAVRGLRSLGARIEFIVPNRFEYGYGLTPEIVRLAAELKPDILLTVDNGIASVDGVAEANRLGMRVLVTDHHLPGDRLPDAACIVNPNQPDCDFPSKNLAGVGVMFYVLLALRAELRERGAFEKSPPAPLLQRGESAQSGGPNLANLLDLVALGTVADVVKLDQNNRILVQQGLQRIRAGRACAGITALLRIAKREPARTSSLDLGFAVGPRLNAAGRLDDMSLGIACLLTDDKTEADRIAKELDALNRERRSIEADMQDSALATLENIDPQEGYTLSLFDEGWHQGVIGILASRLKDKFHRPTIAFARANNGEIKGSGRSIPGLHLRDALDLVSKRHPALIKKFGGHAAAAGLSIAEADFNAFVSAFEQAASELLDENDLIRRIETDGALEHADMTLEIARLLDQQVWGQGFPAPQFDDEFAVANQRVVGEKHLRLRLEKQGRIVDAILFNQADPLPDRVRLVYSLDINEYNGKQSLQLIVRHWQPE
ncbi:MAG: single-stranded-DNA-specific exonuclease RecJ [Gallionella sp.]|jgi:single-stranded-DNA-specific exonuclease|nr:single-stranded-DNA-specific exonuclease RecJ [Gallionella sp.]MCK9355431.1 single-stranded-DNA-specific exonuclease RecJ [Gallionella sp.]